MGQSVASHTICEIDLSLYVENDNRLDRRNSKLCGEGKVLQLFPFISFFSPFAFSPVPLSCYISPSHTSLSSFVFPLFLPQYLSIPLFSLWENIFLLFYYYSFFYYLSSFEGFYLPSILFISL